MSEKRIDEYRKNLPQWVSIGYVSGTHGIKGELKITPMTDDPQRYHLLDKIFIAYPADTLCEYSVKAVRFQKKFILLKLAGIEDLTTAEQLKGRELHIPRENCLELPEDQFYHFELIGLMVYSSTDECIGKVTDVLEMPANDVYVVQSEDKEILLPAIKDVIKKIDLEHGVMTIELLDGLVD